MQINSSKYINRISETIIEKDFASGKVILLIGSRQVGKTTLIKHLLQGKHVHYLNFDLEIDKARFSAASKLDPDEAMQVFQNPDFLVIDEVQRLPEATRVIKGWYDADCPVRMVLLGSSSIQIVDQAAESLAGRNRKRILPPLTFWEVVRSRKWAEGLSRIQIQRHYQDQLRVMLMSCLAFGHYPEAVTSSEKREYLLNLTSDLLWKDFRAMGLIKSPETLTRLLMLLAHQVGSEVSVHELSKSSGLARPTVERYISLLEQTYILFRLPAFSRNQRKEISKSHKIYFWDTGIRNAMLNSFSIQPIRPDIGALWENWVVAEMARQNLFSGERKKLYFWRSRSGSEVDLVIQHDDTLWAFEIKWNPGKKPKKAFSNAYGIPVHVIHSENPLFSLDKMCELD